MLRDLSFGNKNDRYKRIDYNIFHIVFLWVSLQAPVLGLSFSTFLSVHKNTLDNSKVSTLLFLLLSFYRSNYSTFKISINIHEGTNIFMYWYVGSVPWRSLNFFFYSYFRFYRISLKDLSNTTTIYLKFFICVTELKHYKFTILK